MNADRYPNKIYCLLWIFSPRQRNCSLLIYSIIKCTLNGLGPWEGIFAENPTAILFPIHLRLSSTKQTCCKTRKKYMCTFCIFFTHQHPRSEKFILSINLCQNNRENCTDEWSQVSKLAHQWDLFELLLAKDCLIIIGASFKVNIFAQSLGQNCSSRDAICFFFNGSNNAQTYGTPQTLALVCCVIKRYKIKKKFKKSNFKYVLFRYI